MTAVMEQQEHKQMRQRLLLQWRLLQLQQVMAAVTSHMQGWLLCRRLVVMVKLCKRLLLQQMHRWLQEMNQQQRELVLFLWW
jgi:hypothetical protein